MLWVIYCRVSTKKQEQQGESLDNQELACRNYCKNNNIQVLAVYKESFSWKSSDRPVFNEAIENAILNKVNFFVIYDIDRFSREGYQAYYKIKEKLEKNNIELRDSKNIIQKTSYIFEDDDIDMTQYKWNRANPSKYAEVILSTYAEEEGKKVLQRTIPRQIQLEKQGYQVRSANYWFMNKKINTWTSKKVIQVENPEESKRIREMYKLRADWILTDSEIVKLLNIKWYRSRYWNKLTKKQLLKYISHPIYAWIIQRKWTWNKPINTAYKWLVTIDEWNKANRWKYFIIKNNEWVMISNNQNEYKKNVNKDQFVFQKILKYEWKAMRYYTKKWHIYYREAVWCSQPFNISQNRLLELIWAEIEKYYISPEMQKKLNDWLIPFLEEEQKKNKKTKKELEKQLENLDLIDSEATRKNILWKIKDELMEKILDENEKQRNDIKNQLSKIENEIECSTTEAVELLKLLIEPQKLWNNSNLEQKKILVNLFFDELNFKDKKTLEIANTNFFQALKIAYGDWWYTISDETTNINIYKNFIKSNKFLKNFFNQYLFYA